MNDPGLETAVSYQFSAEELRRLVIYRAAIAAGFYNEEFAHDESQLSEAGRPSV